MYTKNARSARATSAAATALWTLFILGAAHGAPQDDVGRPVLTRLEAPVTHVALFKNGIAVVQRTVTLPGGGRFELDALPGAVHGTFWVQSATPLDVRTTEREVELPADGRFDRDPGREFAGRAVRIRLRGEPPVEIAGRVAAFANPAEQRDWSRSFEQPGRWDHLRLSGNAMAAPTPGPGQARYLALDTSEGRTFVDLSMIAYLHVSDPPTTRRVTRPALEITAPDGAPPSTATLSYLAKGLSFAPSYRLDIGDPKTLRIAQTAVLRNELETLAGVDVELISGFPSMEYSHVLSPMSPGATWAGFFAQLSQQVDGPHGNRVAMSQVAMSNAASFGAAEGDVIRPASEGVDLHYHAIGKRDLREGEALHIHVASAEAAYERIVEWKIPDTRDEWGRRIQPQAWERTNAADEDGAWDALRFENPFRFPMTTGPATIVSGPKFQGQRTTRWVNPGQETTVRVTKALAVHTTSAEYEGETATPRDVVTFGGRSFRRVAVRGELEIKNHRAEAVKLMIRREFSGELTGADSDPKMKLLERGVYSVNRRQELVWTLDLAAGEERRLEYTYAVLVNH